MTSIPEQLSAARKSQLDAQFSLLHSFTDRAFDNASRVMALNLALSRDSVERSSRTFSQLLGATSPRDLGLLRSHAEEQMRSVAAYGRELFGIALGFQPYAVSLNAAPFTPAAALAPAALPAPTQVAQTIIEASAPVAKAAENAVQAGVKIIEAVTAPASNGATAVAAEVSHAADRVEETLSALVQEQALKDEPALVQSLEAQALAMPVAEPAPVAKPKPIARAAGKGAPKAAVAAHPLAAPVENKDSATVTRIDARPPKRRK